MLLGVVFSAGKCKKKDKDENPVGVKGNWKITAITNSANQTPANLTSLLEGTFTGGDTSYEFKNNSGTSVESGSYTYDATANTLSFTPSGTSVFTGGATAYTAKSTLTSTTLQLVVNIAAPSKPENNLTISLTKQQ
ncbi:hypothetical protein AD998_05280 [bacterium 336/3]|nr:hypothetical protein AD998_05280 [bacterium 336/3]